MNLEPGKRRGPPPPMYRSPMHGPERLRASERGVDEPRREWLRYQIQGYGRKYWDAVAETDDRARALAEAVKRARVGSIAYRVWDRVDRKEIWRGFGHGASVEEWKTTRPPGMIGENPAKDRSGKGKRGRWSYVVLATKGFFEPFLTKERAMVLLARVRARVAAGDHSPLYAGQGELVIGQVRRAPEGWEFALPGTQVVTYHYDKARDAILRAIRRRPRPNDRRTAMSITTRPLRLRPNPVLSKRMLPLRPNTMRLGEAMRYGKALLEAGHPIRVWDGSGWEVVIHPNDSMATSSGKGASGGRAYLARGAGMVKTWPITLIAYTGQQSHGWMTPGKIRRLIAKARVSANSGQDIPTFYVMHVSVDGAGIHTRNIALKRKAVALAQKLQSKSDRRGNPWGYHYIVYREYPSGRTDAIYRTKSRASANWNGRGRGKHSALMNSHACANERAAHTSIVSAFMAGKSKSFGTSPQYPGTRYVTDGRALRVWGHVVAEKVPGGIRITDAGYQTLLTKNVLNTVLDRLGWSRISQMAHKWYLGSKPWSGEAVIPVGVPTTIANRRRARASANPRRKKFKEVVVAKFRKWELCRLAKRHLEDSGVLAKAYRMKGGPWKLVVKEYNVAKAKTLLRGKPRRNPRTRPARNCHTLLGKAGARAAMKFA